MGLKFKNPIVFIFRPILAQNTLFLDRDGVLNHVVIRGEEISSPRHIEEFKVTEDIDALASTEIKKNWNLVVISNQPDLSRGRIDIELLNCFQDELNKRIPINAIYICPHQSSHSCDCRKPGYGLIKKYRRDYPNLNGWELLVGDRYCDQQCAVNANIPFILRCRDYNQDLLDTSKYIINSLYEIHSFLRKE
jgi:D-glycero-D-manno-heptose 1,7-bisphosphate phosphatase